MQVFTSTPFFASLSLPVQYHMLLTLKHNPSQSIIPDENIDASQWRWDCEAYLPKSEYERLGFEYICGSIPSKDFLEIYLQTGCTLLDYAIAIDAVTCLDPNYFVGWTSEEETVNSFNSN